MHIFLRGLTLDIQRFESLMHYCTQGSNLLPESPIKTLFLYPRKQYSHLRQKVKIRVLILWANNDLTSLK